MEARDSVEIKEEVGGGRRTDPVTFVSSLSVLRKSEMSPEGCTVRWGRGKGGGEAVVRGSGGRRPLDVCL